MISPLGPKITTNTNTTTYTGNTSSPKKSVEKANITGTQALGVFTSATTPLVPNVQTLSTVSSTTPGIPPNLSNVPKDLEAEIQGDKVLTDIVMDPPVVKKGKRMLPSLDLPQREPSEPISSASPSAEVAKNASTASREPLQKVAKRNIPKLDLPKNESRTPSSSSASPPAEVNATSIHKEPLQKVAKRDIPKLDLTKNESRTQSPSSTSSPAEVANTASTQPKEPTHKAAKRVLPKLDLTDPKTQSSSSVSPLAKTEKSEATQSKKTSKFSLNLTPMALTPMAEKADIENESPRSLQEKIPLTQTEQRKKPDDSITSPLLDEMKIMTKNFVDQKKQNFKDKSQADMDRQFRECLHKLPPDEAPLILKKLLEAYAFSSRGEEYNFIVSNLREVFPKINDFISHVVTSDFEGDTLSCEGIRTMIKILQEKGSLTIPCIVCETYEELQNELQKFKNTTGDAKISFIVRNQTDQSIKDGQLNYHVTPIYVEREGSSYKCAITDSLGGSQLYSNIISKYTRDTFGTSPKDCTVYCFSDVSRQGKTDKTNCPIFSIRDIVQMSKYPNIMEFYASVSTERVPGLCFFTKLPPSIKKFTQSVTGIKNFDAEEKKLAELNGVDPPQSIFTLLKTGGHLSPDDKMNLISEQRFLKYQRLLVAKAISEALRSKQPETK